MSIRAYIKDIGRGKEGARSLTRDQAADLFGQLLDGNVSDLEVGAFCLAMRIKGETPQEMAGFLDATHARLHHLPSPEAVRTVVLPSYNGARKLPLLTPLLAALLAREGLAVLIHGHTTEDSRVSAIKVLAALENKGLIATDSIVPGRICMVSTGALHVGLQRLLDVRRVVGLRNPAHSLVKLMRPVTGPALLVTSYTHPEYLSSMGATLALTRTHALLLRGTEGEPVADPRRCPAMDAICDGDWTAEGDPQPRRIQEAQSGSLTAVPELPPPDAESTADWTQAVLKGQRPVPAPVATQVGHILQMATQ